MPICSMRTFCKRSGSYQGSRGWRRAGKSARFLMPGGRFELPRPFGPGILSHPDQRRPKYPHGAEAPQNALPRPLDWAGVGHGLAEGEGVEPLALLRCQHGFRDRLPTIERHLPIVLGGRCRDRTYVAMLMCQLRLSKPLHYRSANLPAINARMIGIDCGGGGRNRTDKDPASKAGMLPVASRPDGRCAVAVRW